jgi:hypothetical protein
MVSRTVAAPLKGAEKAAINGLNVTKLGRALET